MAEKMTLKQVSDGLRTNADDLNRMDSMPMLAHHLRNMADAIDAHLAGMGEPVATLHADGYWAWKGIPPLESNYAGWRLDVYTAPPASADKDAAINNLRSAAQKAVLANADLRAHAAAADALLRGIAGCQWFSREAPATVELINAHLSENGHDESMPRDEYEDEADGWCDCCEMHTIDEIDSGQCDCCGKPISPEEYP